MILAPFSSKPAASVYESEKEWAIKKFSAAVNTGEYVLAIVQTLRQGRRRDDRTWQRISDSEVKKLALAVNKEIGRGFYGRIFRRHGKMPPVIWGHEGKTDEIRDHLNLSVAVPQWISVVGAMSIIELAFERMSWSSGYRRSVDIAWNVEGWASYAIKEKDSFLLDACHFESNSTPRFTFLS